MITCNVTYSPLVGIYLAFSDVDTVRSQDVSGSPPLADDPRSFSSPSIIPTTVRGCCAPPVPSIDLISRQKNVPPVFAPRNHCPRCSWKLPRFAVLCCGCWLRRPSPRPAPGTIPAVPIFHHTRTHPYRGNPRPMLRSTWVRMSVDLAGSRVLPVTMLQVGVEGISTR